MTFLSDAGADAGSVAAAGTLLWARKRMPDDLGGLSSGWPDKLWWRAGGGGI